MTAQEDRAITEAVYAFIQARMQQQGIPPTYREIADAVFISAGSVARHLERLEMWGRIGRLPGRARGIYLLEDDEENR